MFHNGYLPFRGRLRKPLRCHSPHQRSPWSKHTKLKLTKCQMIATLIPSYLATTDPLMWHLWVRRRILATQPRKTDKAAICWSNQLVTALVIQCFRRICHWSLVGKRP
eukprot:Blabericola_migrator_1__254@NODE_1068_length_5539_cov_59_002376_g356_i1_p6_GENE_NODE_1068_length_5539_cov_59_002376_g356_i1NODE_1068_length_5539_cov_59_002376_g356_i1_p6_ORF_typecomplete_len108_score5_02Y_phosphatase2/PF03162_13/0_21_NODE_1068_length_5539_cov_59_002376_g356_i131813504